MLHIFHGEHVNASRKELAKIREKYTGREIIVLDGKTASVTSLIQATEATSFLAENKLVIIENLLIKRLGKKKNDEVIIDFIKKLPTDVTIVFWEEKELGKTILSLFPKNADIAVFKPDKNIFLFTESLVPKNHARSLQLLHRVMIEGDVEYIFSMIIRQIRLLLLAKKLNGSVPGLSPWQVSKLQKQAAMFSSLPQLLILYRKLLDIDVTIKNGSNPFSPSKNIELFICSI